MFGFLKDKDKCFLGAPVRGKVVPLAEVNDPTFGEEILGKGVAIIPEDGKIYAPDDGVINMVFHTKHAVSMTNKKGVEILIHIGLDTVKLNGKPFTTHVEEGEQVKKGQLLITADLDMIKNAGLETITPMVICNSSDYEDVTSKTGIVVNPGDQLLEIKL